MEEKEYVNMCLNLPRSLHSIILVQQSKMQVEKKRKVNIKEAAMHIIREWGKNNNNG